MEKTILLRLAENRLKAVEVNENEILITMDVCESAPALLAHILHYNGKNQRFYTDGGYLALSKNDNFSIKHID